MSDTTGALQTVDGHLLPARGRWTLDRGHAEVAFIGRHFMLTRVRGRFLDVDAAIDVGTTPAETAVAATIAMRSVASGDEARDEHLRSADFFDVEHHPHARFRSTEIEWEGTGGRLHGLLTIKDVERPVVLEVEYLGHVEDPWGGDRAVFSAHGKLNREDWGLTWNMVLESGGIVVSKEIDLEIHAEFVRDA